MATQWLCGAINDHDTPDEARTELKTALDSMAKQLNDWTTEVDYYTYVPSYEIKKDPCSLCESEASYIEGCVEELIDAGYVISGDVWVVVDGAEAYGYGRGDVEVSYNGTDAWGARALYTPSNWGDDPVETFYNLVIQEAGHCFEAYHRHGTYWDPSWGPIYDVSPMATCYTYNANGDVDTCYEGSATPPDSFCGGDSNDINESWCGGCGDPCRHTKYMSACTLDRIVAYSPL